MIDLSITGSRLSIMAVLTKRLPVFHVPEQLVIPPVRYDMIDHGRWGHSAFLHTFRAERMPLKEGFSCFPPSGVVAPGVCTAAHVVCAPLDMLSAKDLPGFAETWASGIPARSRRSPRHNDHLTSPASACRAHRRCCHRSDSSLPGRGPLPAQPRHLPFRCFSLCPA